MFGTITRVLIGFHGAGVLSRAASHLKMNGSVHENILRVAGLLSRVIAV
jgi:hypothetical protein